MIEAGIKFYEFQPARYHCKYMIVDDYLSCVGSCNLDNRSLRLNEEANLNVLDGDFCCGARGDLRARQGEDKKG